MSSTFENTPGERVKLRYGPVYMHFAGRSRLFFFSRPSGVYPQIFPGSDCLPPRHRGIGPDHNPNPPKGPKLGPRYPNHPNHTLLFSFFSLWRVFLPFHILCPIIFFLPGPSAHGPTHPPVVLKFKRVHLVDSPMGPEASSTVSHAHGRSDLPVPVTRANKTEWVGGGCSGRRPQRPLRDTGITKGNVVM